MKNNLGCNHYTEALLHIFESEKDKGIIEGNYIEDVRNLFNLTSLNIFSLQALRDAIVIRFSDMSDKYAKENGKRTLFYMNIIMYVTAVIDQQIYDRGGEV